MAASLPTPPGGRPAPRRPMRGWRVWRVHDGRLRSWLADDSWRPGTNTARCLRHGAAPCPDPPGAGCQCGFWAMFDVLSCFDQAQGHANRPIVVGLIAGWGGVAVHGDEGFRAEHARVLCLFTDLLLTPPVVWSVGQAFSSHWWQAAQALGCTPRPAPLAAPRAARLKEVADAYAVPLTSLAAAYRSGALAELGVDDGMMHGVRRWIALGRPERT